MEKAESGYECSVCNEEHNDLDRMQQHLSRQGNYKFYLCMRCFDGYNTLLKIRHHRKTHVVRA